MAVDFLKQPLEIGHRVAYSMLDEVGLHYGMISDMTPKRVTIRAGEDRLTKRYQDVICIESALKNSANHHLLYLEALKIAQDALLQGRATVEAVDQACYEREGITLEQRNAIFNHLKEHGAY